MSEHTNPILFDLDADDAANDPHERLAVTCSNVEAAMVPGMDPVTILLKSRTIRIEHIRKDHSGIDDISWHILLDLMVSMDSGKPVMVSDLAITHHLAKSTMSRYVAYLIGIGLVEEIRVAADKEQTRLILTASGANLTSGALGEISRQLPDIPDWLSADD
mgnify:CR=1 FL=1